MLIASSKESSMDQIDGTTRAYAAAAGITHDRMERGAPLDAEALRRVTAADVVIVSGAYDHVEMVLDALGTPHTKIAPGELESVTLRPEQLLVVNCPGNVGRGAI